ncbi:hypothetical protein ACODT5_00170 [Streptomyces sp. 5.8]|uniref:hypothetical protein n=1 Tax=Streptomyces sp. 5.8 TaxID=3406571 RepID=UPI003BB4AB24
MSSKARRRRRQPPKTSPAPTIWRSADISSQGLATPEAVDVLVLSAHARDRAADIVDLAKEEREGIRTEAMTQAEACLSAARVQATRVCEEAEHRAREIQQRTREASSITAASAADQAAATKEAALRESTQIISAAEAKAQRVLDDAATRARTTDETAQQRADRVLDEAKIQADQLGSAARLEAAQATSRLRSAEAEATRIRQEAADTDTELRRQAMLDIAAQRERATRDAEDLRRTAATMVTSAEQRAADLIEQATHRHVEATKKSDEADRLLTEATQARARARSRPARRQERKEVRQQGRHRRAMQRIEHRRSKGRPTLAHRLAQTHRWSRELVRNQARRVLVSGPILAPMAVAWWSQTDYAKDAFGWWTVFALGFAAAWELTTAFTGWMYHQARQQGDAGTVYRIMTWVFAAGAAAMNYAHHCGPGGRPTQASVAFATMSIVGMVLWELYASLVHREYLREQGLVSRARPKIGLIRWLRFPVRSWTAWSLTIENASLSTLERAWNAARAELADRNALRSGTTLHRIVIPRVPTASLFAGGGAGPGAIPLFHRIEYAPDGTRRAIWEQPNGTERAPAPDAGARTGAAGRSEAAVPLDFPTTDQATPRVPLHRALSARTSAGASSPATELAPYAATPDGRTAERSGTDRAGERDAPVGAERAHRNDQYEDERPSGAKSEAAQMVLEAKERAAVERLVAKRQLLSKRSISDEVRTDGDTIADSRALELANYLNAEALHQLGQHLARI